MLEDTDGKTGFRHIVPEELSMVEDAGGEKRLRDPVSERSAILEDAGGGTDFRDAGWERSRTETDAPGGGTGLRGMAYDRSGILEYADEGTGVWYSGSKQ